MENTVKKSDDKKTGQGKDKTTTNDNKTDKKGQTHENMLDPIAFTRVMADIYDRAQPLIQEFFEKADFDLDHIDPDPMNVGPAYFEFMSKLMADPQRLMELQMKYWQDWYKIWQESAIRFMGGEAGDLYHPEKGDRRFKNPLWHENVVFDFILQSYLMSSNWIENTVNSTEGLSDDERRKLEFATRQVVSAMSPSNFLMTNPEVIQETIDTGGENLIKGLKNLIEDLEKGKGELEITTTDEAAFKIGENLAVTPGKVVYQNDLMQLIQYEPKTKQVHKRPLLIVPPWINKFYILDLKPDNSLIKWMVEQGLTVFTISWVNPDKKLSKKRFEDYMEEGVLTALKQIEKITGEPDCNAMGYCLGGTLLSVTLSWLKEKKQAHKINAATFLTTLVDFEKAGDMKLFIDDTQLAVMEKEMAEKGFFPAESLKRTFSLMRSNDLIWSFVVNNYLMGREPFPFDLLFWNEDATNMPAAMHSFYLRKLYRENLLKTPGGVTMNGVPIDVSKIETPCYFLSTKEDHIAPWVATYATTQLVKGPAKFTLAASGHVAGVVNPPEKHKYCYWSYDENPADCEEWIKNAKATEGSWWPDWYKWIKQHAGEKVAARKIGKSIEDAPGTYVKMRAD